MFFPAKSAQQLFGTSVKLESFGVSGKRTGAIGPPCGAPVRFWESRDNETVWSGATTTRKSLIKPNSRRRDRFRQSEPVQRSKSSNESGETFNFGREREKNFTRKSVFSPRPVYRPVDVGHQICEFIDAAWHVIREQFREDEFNSDNYRPNKSSRRRRN
jgi:hypothetical protein